MLTIARLSHCRGSDIEDIKADGERNRRLAHAARNASYILTMCLSIKGAQYEFRDSVV